MKIYVDGNPVEVEIYIDTTTNALSLVTGDKKTSVQLMKIYGNGQGLGQAILDHILLNGLTTATIGTSGASSKAKSEPNKHVKPL